MPGTDWAPFQFYQFCHWHSKEAKDMDYARKVKTFQNVKAVVIKY